ncbi:MAG TPA: nitroreductase/quinone reductase family protein [Streptosporangiaceae bacterium]|nr:nitroreductase/quinone reductase family protein [Streptosporangiaceae bacterium]
MPPTAQNRPLSRRLQADFMRVLNVPMRRVLGLPFATPLSGRLMLLYLTGRKTGKSYHQPVSYVRQGTTLLTPGGGKWKLNLVEGQPVRIHLAGQDRLFRPEVIRDPDQVEELLKLMTDANPAASKFVGIPRNPDGSFDRERLENALRYGFAIVRWHPVEPAAEQPAGQSEQPPG